MSVNYLDHMPKAESFAAIKFSPRRIGHANVFVTDVFRSAEFYTNVCGVEEIGREMAIPAIFISNGNTHHDYGLVRVSPDGQERRGRDGHVQLHKGRGLKAGLNHFGWEMENEYELVEAYKRASAADLPLHRLTDHQTTHSIYIFDPEGFLHEMYADMTTDWRSILGGDITGLISGGWEPLSKEPTKEIFWDPTPPVAVVPGAPFRPRRISRIVLVVQQMERMIDFYTNVLGLAVAAEAADRSWMCLHGKNSAYDTALIQAKSGEEPHMHHNSLELADESDFAAAAERLAALGHGIDREVDNAAKRSIFLEDPDGMRVEFYAEREPGFDHIAQASADERRYML